MCGRYSITSPIEAIQRIFDVPERPNLAPRYNVAPTQDAPVVRLEEDGARHLTELRWGLVPFWAEDPSIASRMINARGESVAEKPAFRAAFRQRRCLVVADGFYEWRKPVRKGGAKQPYRITLADGGPFAFAGLWERWIDPSERRPVDTFTIVTTDANERLKPIHPRMPVILDSSDFDTWLDPAHNPGDALALLKSFPEDRLDVYPVSTRVNNVANDDPEVIRREDTAADTEAKNEPQPRLL